MTDYTELKRLAEAATQCSGPRRVETDYNGVHQVVGDGGWKILNAWHTPDGKGLENAQFTAAASPTAVLALIAENDRLQEAHEQICTNYNQVSYASEERGKQIDQLKAELEHTGYDHDLLRSERDQLKAESEALRKRIDDMSPFKGAPLTGQDPKCLACGGYHYGMGGLPCPSMRVTAQADLPETRSGQIGAAIGNGEQS